jgi:hypothetical protein
MPRLLDLFCGAGGAGMGYHRAGFVVVGVDIDEQPHYPFEFHQADALEYMRDHGNEFDAIHASPPCQRYSECTPIRSRHKHPDLIGQVRELLLQIGKPYVIENVDGARRLLRSPRMLCGTMFGLPIWRHRWFETGGVSWGPMKCRHNGHPVLVCGSSHGRGEAKVPRMIEVMQVPWMKVRKEVRQAIPPAYTEYIGKQLFRCLGL